MRSLPLFTFLLLAAQYAYSQEWTPVRTSNPNVLFAIDLGSIERDGDLAMFRERLSYQKPDTVDEASGMLIREKLVHRVMDCKNKTQGMLSGSMRSESGSLIEQVTFDRNQLVMAPIPGGSLAEKELDMVCNHAAKPAPR
jgi:hypothetical protein